jgi:Cof subfamily protein (haloacid dehalogenase superfamily)
MKVTVEGEEILDKRFGSQLSKDVIEFANERKMCLLTLVDSVQYYSSLEGLKKFEDTNLNYDDILGRQLVPIEKVNYDRIYSMGLVGSDGDAKSLQAAFPQIKVTEVFHSLWYDVIAKGVSKAVGMEHLLKHFNKTWEDVIAFGDSMNDYEIMSHAGFSVAMGNASEKLKKIADFITKDIDDDGIAYALRNIMI